jgi:hypothetical protein
MRLSEARLRQIVLEEVQLRLVEYYIDQEIEALISEDEKADWDAAKWKARKKKIRDASLGALGLGTVAGALGGEVTDYEDTLGAKNAARKAQNMADAATDDARFEKFTQQLNNQYAFRWGKGDNAVVFKPGSGRKTTVLPASYSIAVQALQDKKTNAERMELGLRPFERYGEIDLDNLRDSDRSYEGNLEQNIDSFFKTHEGNFVNAFDVVSRHDELETVPGHGAESRIEMVHPDKISGDYYLPELGMTAADYYNSQYGYFMGSGEIKALEQSDEEVVVTPDDDDKEMLDQGLIDATNKRALKYQQRSMKEGNVTWKNYKNRKKVLA